MRLFTCLLLAAASAVVLSAQPTRITWIGQACFYVQTDGGPTVVTDPPAANIGYALPATPADAVTISHSHGDHSNSAGVRGSFALVDGRQVTVRTPQTSAGTPFVLIPGFHDRNNSATNPNTIITWTQGGLKFAHFGDYGQEALTAAQLADLQNVDVMMLPGGGQPFTLDNARLPELVDQVKPRIAIVMHFRTALGGPAQLPTAPFVANPFPAVKYKPATVALTRATLPAQPEVWVMEPAADTLVTSAATIAAGVPVAPGSLATIWSPTTFGTIANTVANIPLPVKLADAEVVIGTGSAAAAVPLLFASNNQINFQVPQGLNAGQYAIEVRIAGQRVARGSITLVERSPGIFAVVDDQGRLNRARRGSYITLYGTGQGAIFNAPRDGIAAGLEATTTATPEATLAGVKGDILYSGLAPGWVGLWQVNVQIPATAPSGNGAPLVIQFSPNFPSNVVQLTVE